MSATPPYRSGGSGGNSYSVAVPVFGSSLPMNIRLWSGYHGVPVASIVKSCGTVPARGRSYCVMMTRVDCPVGRGSAFSSYGQVARPPLRFTLARYSASALLGGAAVVRAPADVLRLRSSLGPSAPALIADRRSISEICLHARDDRHELLGRVARLHDALVRVAVGAADGLVHELVLLLGGARHAREPFKRGQLRRQVGGLDQSQIQRGRLRGGHVLRPGGAQVVPGRPDAHVVLARHQVASAESRSVPARR